MKSWVVAIVMAVLSISTAYGEVIETMHFDTLKEHVDAETLIVLDIDNTLLETTQALGSDQWFYHHLKSYIAKGMSADKALDLALQEWGAVQNLTDVKLVEEGTAKTVAELQDKGYVVMGLTTRGLGMSSLAILQLRKLGIELSRTAPTDKQIFFTNHHDAHPDAQQGVIFRQGVLFTAGTHKGSAFTQLMDKLDLKPKKVVFVNDKATHIQPLAAACEAREIPFVGLRYGATDHTVKGYDPEVGRVQWEAFGVILSDDQAKQRLAG